MDRKRKKYACTRKSKLNSNVQLIVANKLKRLAKLRKAGLMDDKLAEPLIEYPDRSEDWLSCQIDINKLVQPNNLNDEKILPTQSILPTEANDVAETKNILPAQTNYIIDEEFIPEEKCINIKLIDFDEKKDVSPIDADEWVLEETLCRCCHAEGVFSSLQDTAPSEHITYNEMLSTCFNIQLFPVSGSLSAALCGLCGQCAARLRDAHSLRQQVRASEARLLHLCQMNCIKVPASIHIEVKEELNADDNDVAAFIPREVKEELNADENSASPVEIKVEVGSPRADEVEQEVKSSKVTPKGNNIKKTHTEKRKKPAKGKCLLEHVEQAVKSSKVTPKGNNIKKTHTEKRKKPAKGKCLLEHALQSAPRQKIVPVVPAVYCTRIGDSYKCIRCEKMYQKRYIAKRHFKKIHLKLIRDFECTHCSKTFKTDVRLKIHKLEAHNINEQLQCNACDKMFYTKRQLSSHLNTYHMMGDKMQCSMCDYVCYDKYALQKHEVKHKTTKDFHCKYCKKSFMRNTSLKLHERIHTGDKRKECAECGQAFVQKASLNYHMTKHHPAVKF